MYTAFAIIFVLIVLAIVETFSGIPVVDKVKAFVEQRLVKGYVSFFLWPVVFLGALYGVAALASLFVGLPAALDDVSTACLMGFLLGLFACFCSFSRDALSLAYSTVAGRRRRYTGDFALVTSLLFLTCFYGSIGALFFGSTSKWCIFH